mmetsp:Transcript_17071/g.46819  ORF Transcript_17071/g.46819 Transcript_17071/m.46819 type:complete len:240 (+) Transcript_17071:423-1142(+)
MTLTTNLPTLLQVVWLSLPTPPRPPCIIVTNGTTNSRASSREASFDTRTTQEDEWWQQHHRSLSPTTTTILDKNSRGLATCDMNGGRRTNEPVVFLQSRSVLCYDDGFHQSIEIVLQLPGDDDVDWTTCAPKDPWQPTVLYRMGGTVVRGRWWERPCWGAYGTWPKPNGVVEVWNEVCGTRTLVAAVVVRKLCTNVALTEQQATRNAHNLESLLDLGWAFLTPRIYPGQTSRQKNFGVH